MKVQHEEEPSGKEKHGHDVPRKKILAFKKLSQCKK